MAKRNDRNWLGVDLSPELREKHRRIARRIKGDELSDRRRPAFPHVTVASGFDTPSDREAVLALLRRPIGAEIEVGDPGLHKGKKDDVLKLDVISDDLRNAHKDIDTKHAYSPHITAAFLRKGVDADKYMEILKEMRGHKFKADRSRAVIDGKKLSLSSENMHKKSSVSSEQLGAMVPFMDLPYAAGLASNPTESEIEARKKDKFTDIALPPVGAFRYGQRIKEGMKNKEATGPYEDENYRSEVFGPYTSTAATAVAALLGELASRGRGARVGKALAAGAGTGALLNLAGWGAAKIDRRKTKAEMRERDSKLRWANWLVPGASKYNSVTRVESMFDKVPDNSHVLNEDGKLKPGVYIASRSVFRGVPVLSSFLKNARHSYIVAVPANPEKFKDYTVDLGNGNHVILMGGYNEPLPEDKHKRQLAAAYNKPRDIDTFMTGIGMKEDTKRNYTKIKYITKGLDHKKIDDKISNLIDQMNTYQVNTAIKPVVYKAYPTKNPKKLIKKRVSNCNSWAQTLLDRAGFDNRKTKVNNPNNRFAPGDNIRIGFAFQKPAVQNLLPENTDAEKGGKEEMKKAAFLQGYKTARSAMYKKADAIANVQPYGRIMSHDMRRYYNGVPVYGEPVNEQGENKEPKAPVMGDSSVLISPITTGIFGDGAAGTAADIGTYFIPGVGLARTGYDTVSDFANMFGKGLTAKQRLGYALSSGFNAAFTGAELLTLGTGLGGAAGLVLKPLSRMAKGIKGGEKVRRGIASFRRGSRAIQQGTSAATKGIKGMPLRFLYSKNPYVKTIKKVNKKTGKIMNKKVFWSNPKALTYGTARTMTPLGGIIYSSTLTAPPKSKMEDDKIYDI